MKIKAERHLPDAYPARERNSTCKNLLPMYIISREEKEVGWRAYEAGITPEYNGEQRSSRERRRKYHQQKTMSI